MTGPTLEPQRVSPDALTRHQFLTLVGVASVAGMTGLAACSHATASSSLTANVVALPRTRPWHPQKGEVDPSVKACATLLVKTVDAWTASAGTVAAARKRAAEVAFDPSLVDALAPLLGDGHSAVLQVSDAQYSGILGTSASVLVVVDQWRLMPNGSLRVGGTTVDVRLAKVSPHWRTVDVLPTRPGSPMAHLTSVAQRVLFKSRIRLPDTARADVLASGIHDTVLALLLEISTLHVMVSV